MTTLWRDLWLVLRGDLSNQRLQLSMALLDLRTQQLKDVNAKYFAYRAATGDKTLREESDAIAAPIQEELARQLVEAKKRYGR